MSLSKLLPPAVEGSCFCAACWNWWWHPDEDNGVQERGGYVGHQSRLQKEVRSLSVYHNPGTTADVHPLLSVISFTVFNDIHQQKKSQTPLTSICLVFQTYSSVPLCALKHQLGVHWFCCLYTIHISAVIERLVICFKCLVQPDETTSLPHTQTGMNWCILQRPDVHTELLPDNY